MHFLPKWQLPEESPNLSFPSHCIDPLLSQWACDARTQFPPNPKSTKPSLASLQSPLEVEARAPHGAEEIDKWTAASLPPSQKGRAASLTASRLGCLFAVSLQLEHCWRCTSQMGLISFEVVPLEAQEQSNRINSCVGAREAGEVPGPGGAQVEKTEQRHTGP